MDWEGSRLVSPTQQEEYQHGTHKNKQRRQTTQSQTSTEDERWLDTQTMTGVFNTKDVKDVAVHQKVRDRNKVRPRKAGGVGGKQQKQYIGGKDSVVLRKPNLDLWSSIQSTQSTGNRTPHTRKLKVRKHNGNSKRRIKRSGGSVGYLWASFDDEANNREGRTTHVPTRKLSKEGKGKVTMPARVEKAKRDCLEPGEEYTQDTISVGTVCLTSSPKMLRTVKPIVVTPMSAGVAHEEEMDAEVVTVDNSMVGHLVKKTNSRSPYVTVMRIPTHLRSLYNDIAGPSILPISPVAKLRGLRPRPASGGKEMPTYHMLMVRSPLHSPMMKPSDTATVAANEWQQSIYGSSVHQETIANACSVVRDMDQVNRLERRLVEFYCCLSANGHQHRNSFYTAVKTNSNYIIVRDNKTEPTGLDPQASNVATSIHNRESTFDIERHSIVGSLMFRLDGTGYVRLLHMAVSRGDYPGLREPAMNDLEIHSVRNVGSPTKTRSTNPARYHLVKTLMQHLSVDRENPGAKKMGCRASVQQNGPRLDPKVKLVVPVMKKKGKDTTALHSQQQQHTQMNTKDNPIEIDLERRGENVTDDVYVRSVVTGCKIPTKLHLMDVLSNTFGVTVVREWQVTETTETTETPITRVIDNPPVNGLNSVYLRWPPLVEISKKKLLQTTAGSTVIGGFFRDRFIRATNRNERQLSKEIEATILIDHLDACQIIRSPITMYMGRRSCWDEDCWLSRDEIQTMLGVLVMATSPGSFVVVPGDVPTSATDAARLLDYPLGHQIHKFAGNSNAKNVVDGFFEKAQRAFVNLTTRSTDDPKYLLYVVNVNNAHWVLFVGVNILSTDSKDIRGYFYYDPMYKNGGRNFKTMNLPHNKLPKEEAGFLLFVDTLWSFRDRMALRDSQGRVLSYNDTTPTNTELHLYGFTQAAYLKLERLVIPTEYAVSQHNAVDCGVGVVYMAFQLMWSFPDRKMLWADIRGRTGQSLKLSTRTTKTFKELDVATIVRQRIGETCPWTNAVPVNKNLLPKMRAELFAILDNLSVITGCVNSISSLPNRNGYIPWRKGRIAREVVDTVEQESKQRTRKIHRQIGRPTSLLACALLKPNMAYSRHWRVGLSDLLRSQRSDTGNKTSRGAGHQGCDNTGTQTDTDSLSR